MTTQQSPRKGEKPKCLLLKLPSDLIFLIADALALHDQALLSETCTALRALLFHHIEKPWADRTRQQQINYLGALSRMSLDWYCTRCGKIHPVKRGKVKNRCKCTCLRNADDVCLRHDCLDLTLRDAGYKQETITLALRYHRLGNLSWQQQKDLSRILSPSPGHWVDRAICRVEKMQQIIAPKIVDGRFLVLTEHRLLGDYPIRAYLCDFIVDVLFAWVPETPVPDYHRPCSKLLYDTEKAAAENIGVEQTTFCPHCPSEVSVKVTKKSDIVVIRLWQDFGPEASLEYSIWAKFNQCSLRDPPASNLDACPSPWRIRELYESE